MTTRTFAAEPRRVAPFSYCPGRSREEISHPCIPPGRGSISLAPSLSRHTLPLGAAPGECSPGAGRDPPLTPPLTRRVELGGANAAGGSPAALPPPWAARAPPHPGLKPRGRLVAALGAPSGARRCQSAPAAGTMRPAPALALAALCLLALPAAAAAAAYFGSVPVASPRSACPFPGSSPCEASNSASCPDGTPGGLPGLIRARILRPWLSELRLHPPFSCLSLRPLPCLVPLPGGCQAPAQAWGSASAGDLGLTAPVHPVSPGPSVGPGLPRPLQSLSRCPVCPHPGLCPAALLACDSCILRLLPAGLRPGHLAAGRDWW